MRPPQRGAGGGVFERFQNRKISIDQVVTAKSALEFPGVSERFAALHLNAGRCGASDVATLPRTSLFFYECAGRPIEKYDRNWGAIA
jgi:hypothetical protein